MTLIEQQAAADLVDGLVKRGRSVQSVVQDLVENGLKGQCSAEELTAWFQRWKKKACEHWPDQVPVDPEALDRMVMENWQRDPVHEKSGEIAAGMLRMMDRRLLRDVCKWKDTEVALQREEQRLEVRRGAGRVRQADGQVIEWVAYAVVTLTHEGVVCRVFPECIFRGCREPRNRVLYGVLRLRRPVVVRRADNNGTSQAVGTLLLLYKGDAAGFHTHADLASLMGKTRANGSAKARRMAEENVRTGGRATFAILRCRETVGRKRMANHKRVNGGAA